MKAITLLFLSTVSMASFSTEFSDLDGNWGTDCDYNKGLINFDEGRVFMELYPNQAYIELIAKNDNNGVSLLFKNVADVGRGGSEINWDDISAKHIVAIATNVKEKTFNLEVIGLTSKANGAITHTPARAEKHNKMKRCIFKLTK